ncbi:MAG TPA: 30S ribosomal protein S6 [Acidimicrobiales bacterium]|jgi:small subunit ribosomal protein S6|nr:30S ribosomal protein S6 [Acidimicrobiales bacterium]
MRPYEAMVILDASMEESAVQGVINRTSELLEPSGSQLTRADKWGKRRFAYEIDHRSEGYYLLLELALHPDAVAEIDRSLRLTDGVVRHKIVRLPERAGRAAPAPADPALAGSEQ